jgi:hypothetical protein
MDWYQMPCISSVYAHYKITTTTIVLEEKSDLRVGLSPDAVEYSRVDVEILLNYSLGREKVQ